MEHTTKPRGQIRLFACGGGGINIGKFLSKYEHPQQGMTFAQLNTVYVDTSYANVGAENVTASNVMIVGEGDGSGSLRRENAETIVEHIPSLLLKHPPMDLNIVVFTSAGGSGSVIGPSIVSELLARDELVLVVTIGSRETSKYAENTLNTLKSLEAVARLRKKPVVMYYEENNDQRKRSQVDTGIVSTFGPLLALFSRNNAELDSQDLFNWINYHRVVDGVTPALSRLEVLSRVNQHAKGEVISVATLTSIERGTEIDLGGQIPEHQCVGFISQDISETLIEALPAHFAITDDVHSVIKDLQDTLSKVEEIRNARVKRTSFVSDEEISADNGLVL